MKIGLLFILCVVQCCCYFGWFVTGERVPYKNYIVVSHRGHDIERCLNRSSRLLAWQYPCEKLEYVFESISNDTRNSTEVIIEPGTYNLTKNASFEGIFELGISGNGSEFDIKIHCSPDVGFAFIRSSGISIQNVSLLRCGALHHSTIGSAFQNQLKNHTLFYGGIFMAYCKNITILHSRISQSRGIGLTLYDVGGNVVVSKTHFIENTPNMSVNFTKENNYAFAGGGVYVELTYDGALPPFDVNDPERLEYQRDGCYLFDGCTFDKNEAPEQYFKGTLIEFPEGTDHMPFGRGGGLSIFIKGNASNNNFTIKKSHFTNNNALWGAGLFIEYQDQTEDNHLWILDSTFQDNTAYLSGGGVRSGIPIWEEGLSANTIMHKNNIFSHNKAMLGGGVSYYGPFNSIAVKDAALREVKYSGCVWRNNSATLGSALGLCTSLIDLTLRSLQRNPVLPYVVVLEDAIFSGNRIIATGDQKMIGQGAVYSSGVPITFCGNTLFQDNSQTALVLDSAFIRTFGNLTFTENTGMFGGAIGLYGLSLIELMPRVKLNFTRNHATEKGGAIHVGLHGPPILEFETTELDLHYCFLGYNGTNTVQSVENWEVEMIFDSNTAKRGGGNSVYAYSLQTCRKAGEGRESQAMQWPFITYISANGKTNDSEEISTEPIYLVTKPKEWNVSPGEVFQVDIDLRDEKNNSAQGIVGLSLVHQESLQELNVSSPLLLVDPAQVHENSSQIFNLMIQGKPCRYDLTFTTFGAQTLKTYLTDLNLKNCSPGFRYDRDVQKCTCLKLPGMSKCTDGKNVHLLTGYWGGMVDGEFKVYSCPPGYCSEYVTNAPTTGVYLFDSSKLCAKNRKGILCGECRENCSVLIGSENCEKDCAKSSLYWFVPVFCVASVIFVFIVLAIDVEFFTVYLNAWLYSYQILPYLINERYEIFTDHDDRFLPFVIGLANWRIKISKLSLCLPGLTGMQKLYLEYLFPLYVFFALLVIWLISKYCRRFPNIGITRAFCNLVVLVYTGIVLTSFKLTHYVKLNKIYYFYYDTSIQFKAFHVIPAGILLFLGFIIAVLLLCIPQICSCVTRSPKYQNVRLLFDHFQDCFEEENNQRSRRWFAGFYFLCRFVMFPLAFYVPVGPLRRSILETFCVLVACVFLFVKPYNSRYWWLNITDSALLVNLCLVAIFSTRTAVVYNHRQDLNSGFKDVVHVLSYGPVLYLVLLLCLTCWKGWRRLDECYRQKQNRDEEASTTTPEHPNASTPLLSAGSPSNSLVSRSYSSASPVVT